MREKLLWFRNQAKKLCCLRGIVAIIFTILFINAVMCRSVLGAILYFIFALWSYQAIYAPFGSSSCGSKGPRNRGRGGGFKVRSGKISLTRRLGRRRRTGKFISSKEVKVK